MRQKNSYGFTLIELLVVIAILALFAVAIIPNIMDEPDKAKITKAKLDMKTFSQALEMYRLDNNRYPTTDQGLNALVAKPDIEPVPKSWKKNGYISGGKLPKDPWDNEYVYLSPTENNAPFDIISYGADGLRGGEDTDADIRLSEIE